LFGSSVGGWWGRCGRCRRDGWLVRGSDAWFGEGDDGPRTVQAILEEEVVQGHAGDRDAQGVADEVEEIPACGVRVLVQEVGNGSGEAWQTLAVGASAHAVMSGLNDFLGGESLLGRGSGATELEQAGDLSDWELELAVQEKMTEKSDGVIVASAALQESESGQ